MMKQIIRPGAVLILITLIAGFAGAGTIHDAAARGKLQEIEALLSGDPALLEQRNERHLTPLHCACLEGRLECVRLLVSKGADVDAGDHDGRTPLLFALWRNHLKVVKHLIAGGAAVDMKDGGGQAPLHQALINGQSDMAKVLVEGGADIRMANGEGCLPLHLAAMKNDRSSVNLLLEKGADVNSTDEGGDTAAHFAAWNGALQAVELLAGKGARIHTRNRQGQAPIDYAARAGHPEVVALLEARGVALSDRKAVPATPDRKIDRSDTGERAAVTLTVLYDNFTAVDGTRADWGFSCLVEGFEKTFLFDAGGNPEVLMQNTGHMNADLSRIDGIVVSHIHWDHVGGVLRVLEGRRDLPVYVPRSFPYSFVRRVEKTGGTVVAVKDPAALCPHFYTTGEMGIRIREQSLILNTAEGLVIVTGCSHQGIAGIVKKARGLFDKEILLVFGGFHLMQHSDRQVQEIIDVFRNCGVRKCGATHCTGERQIELFREAYGDDFISIGTGRQIVVSEEGLEVLQRGRTTAVDARSRGK